MFGKKNKAEKEPEQPSRPAPVKAGSDDVLGVSVGDHNDPNRIVVMRQSYIGIPEKDFKFRVDESMTSVAYIEGSGYVDEYIVGSVQPSKYWEKKILGTKPVEVSVLSFSDLPFTLVSGITFRVPGGTINGTVRGSFKFVKGNPRSIASLLGSSFAQEKVNYDVKRKYINAENFEQMIRTAFQDDVREPLFRETIYNDLDEVQNAIKQKIKDTPFFFERSIDVSEISVRPEATDVEKLQDEEVKHRIQMRMAEMDVENRQKAVELAKAESDQFKKI